MCTAVFVHTWATFMDDAGVLYVLCCRRPDGLGPAIRMVSRDLEADHTDYIFYKINANQPDLSRLVFYMVHPIEIEFHFLAISSAE